MTLSIILDASPDPGAPQVGEVIGAGPEEPISKIASDERVTPADDTRLPMGTSVSWTVQLVTPTNSKVARIGGPGPQIHGDKLCRLSLEVAGEPQPQGSTRIRPAGGRYRITTDNERLYAWRRLVAGHARRAMVGRLPFNGPVVIEALFKLPRPGGHYGKRGLRPAAPADHIVPPDCDKLLRALLDALTDGKIWKDDSQVACVVGWKRCDEHPGVSAWAGGGRGSSCHSPGSLHTNEGKEI